MFQEEEFLDWCRKLNLSEQAQRIIRHIRSSDPSRLVQSGRGSMSGRYPSRKMGVTIQFESHKNELPHIYSMEHDDDVKEFYDQPAAIKLDYESAKGRHLGIIHTPDFFVLRQNMAGWEECKTEEKLLELEAREPNRYCRDENGEWRCLPGEKYAKEFGLYYRIVSSKNINWIYQRNIEFLDDYYRTDAPVAAPATRDCVLSRVEQAPGLKLGELFTRTEGVASRDDIFMMIAHDQIYVDLYAVPLVEPEYVKVFLNQTIAIAYGNMVEVPYSATVHAPAVIDLIVGSSLDWDGSPWNIINVGERYLGLIGIDHTFTELPVVAFEELVKAGRITSVKREPEPITHHEVSKRLAEASKESLAEANLRIEIVRTHLRGEPLPAATNIPVRTLRRWVAKFRHAERSYSCGYVGLLPRSGKGNRRVKLPPESQKLINDFVQNDYETLKQKKKWEVYVAYLHTCTQKGIVAASYKTFCRAIKKRSRYQQTLARQGRRAAYKEQEFYWELEQTTPRHGERPFHIAHIDHTQADEELLCARTNKNLGRPWVTFLTDADSRRLLAKYTTYDPPSYRSCMMVIRECVRRFRRIPQIVIVDGGLEFSSVYFETLLARHEATKKTRPPAEPRFGSTIERLFGTVNTEFFHNLQGNTQIMKNVRQVTKSVNPKNQALWTLEALDQKLTEWGYEVYDQMEHPALHQTPREAFTHGMQAHGERSNRLIPYDEDFRMLTLPTTNRGTAKVQENGVKINYRYFWSDAFRHPEVEGSNVGVRFDPWDGGTAYAFVRGSWVICHSEKYSIFHNRSEREIMLASAELRKRDSRHAKQRYSISAAKLAEFLQSTEAEEVLLRQRLADRAARSAWALAQGESAATNQAEAKTSVDSSGGVAAASGDAQSSESDPPKSVRQKFKLQVYGDF